MKVNKRHKAQQPQTLYRRHHPVEPAGDSPTLEPSSQARLIEDPDVNTLESTQTSDGCAVYPAD